MRKNFKLFVMTLLLALSFLSCKNKKNTEPAPVAYGELILHIHSRVDLTQVDGYGTVYTSSAGRKISVEKMQLYISGIELVKLDGSLYSIPDSVLLLRQENMSYTLGYVPAGNYKAIRFHVGFNPTQNQLASTSYSSGVLNHSEMWMGASAQSDGYVFVNFKGKIDTTRAMNAAVADMVPFEYRIGTNSHYKQIVMPDQPFTVFPDNSAYVHFFADYMKLFNNIDLRTNSQLKVLNTSDNAGPVATLVASNISNIFSLE